jgi:hypothetical protein
MSGPELLPAGAPDPSLSIPNRARHADCRGVVRHTGRPWVGLPVDPGVGLHADPYTDPTVRQSSQVSALNRIDRPAQTDPLWVTPIGKVDALGCP